MKYNLRITIKAKFINSGSKKSQNPFTELCTFNMKLTFDTTNKTRTKLY